MTARTAARAEAKRNKSPRYFTGTACKRGHVDERYTLSGNCVSCQQETNAEASPSYYLANAQRIKTRSAAWREANAEYKKDYYRRNAERFRADVAAWRQANPGLVRSQCAKRHAAKLRATPPWADHEAIDAIYIEAVRITLETGIPHDVDHHYPLQGKSSCGLHVPWNLKIITARANRQKGNKMPEEYFHAAA